MICFQISIFEPLETTDHCWAFFSLQLWFAFKLVSLNHWKQHNQRTSIRLTVVICFQISIFEPLETTKTVESISEELLWFAFKLVSLNHWKQRHHILHFGSIVVICFQISIFEPLETTILSIRQTTSMLWFAFKLVSLNHWKQHQHRQGAHHLRCDLLSN